MDWMDDHSVLWLPPLLPAGRLRTVLPLVVLFGDVVPVSGKDSSAAGLEALHHGSPLLLITVLVDLLEEQRPSIDSVLLVVIQDVPIDLLAKLVPVVLHLGTGGVVELTLLHALRNTQSVPSQEAPVLVWHLLLHDDLDGVQSQVVFGTHSIDLLEQSQVQLVEASVFGDGKIDAESVLLELNFQLLLLLDGEGDFDAHLSGSLIPGVLVALRVPQDLVFEDVLLAQLDDSTLVEGGLTRLLYSLSEVNTHEWRELYLISDSFSKLPYLYHQPAYTHRQSLRDNSLRQKQMGNY